ncbi:lysine-specific demethylase JMJ703-like [Zingiber officinale]|uniref:lysine-specific demethylase JMJ703-like n=1 Tax=Zingiber officinale TaxID=94328 RepID=UPI001C4CAC2C|nr:lysine-specific demethylase JMJ703-like [Zingiber officinale]
MGTKPVGGHLDYVTGGIPPVPPGFPSLKFVGVLADDATDGIPPVPPGFSPLESVETHVDGAVDGIPSNPPSFSSLTSFTLKRAQDDRVVTPDTSYKGRCSILDEKHRSLFHHRPWLNYNEFNNRSDQELGHKLFEQDLLSTTCLPKGVIRGCSICKTCQEVTARWRPKEACELVLDEAPVYYPSEEEFKDSLDYIAKIRPIAEKYGICRIVPPSSWRRPCLLKRKNLWLNSKFSPCIQHVDKLQNHHSSKIKGNHGIMSTKRQKFQKITDSISEIMLENNQLRDGNNCNKFGFEPGPDFTLESFQKYADDFKEQYFQKVIELDLTSDKPGPLVQDIEGEYWRIVERPTEGIEVLYGADLDTSVFGSGFPEASTSSQYVKVQDQYVNSGWNLNNLARLPGSVLSLESKNVPGIIVPLIDVGMCFSSFCWHVEGHHLYSLKYLHLGAPKIWYGVPAKDASKLEDAMKKHLPYPLDEKLDLLHSRVTNLSPSLLRLEGVPIYRCVQNPGEFVLTFPRAYHSGFSCGFNCAEAVNVAPLDWLPYGQNAVELYRDQRQRLSISHDKLLLAAAREAVRAQWNVLFLGETNSENTGWKNFSAFDGVLTKSLEARIEMERRRREYLCSSRSQKMDTNFNAEGTRECFMCHYDLHLSAAFCLCSPDRFACLFHAKNLCSCSWSMKRFLFLYEISELNVLLDALRGKSSAIHRWGVFDMKLSVSSLVSEMKKQKLIIMTDEEGRGKDHEEAHSTLQPSSTRSI